MVGVLDPFMHETAERAHVFLPAAALAEKEGTFTNSERRVQRVRPALPPPGEARPDWWITCELAKRVARRFGMDVGGQFDYAGPAAIFDEMARLTPLLAGLSHGPPGHALPVCGILSDGARPIHPGLQTVEAAELPDRDFPFVLTPLSLALRDADAPGPGAPGARAAPRDRHPSERRVAAWREHRLADPCGLAARRADRPRAGHRAVRPGAVFVPFVNLEESEATSLTTFAFAPSSKTPKYYVPRRA